MTSLNDISGQELAKRLEKFGYEFRRQKGSHIRLRTFMNGEHHITIPNHNPMRRGTLMGVIKDVASHLIMDRQELIRMIFNG